MQHFQGMFEADHGRTRSLRRDESQWAAVSASMGSIARLQHSLGQQTQARCVGIEQYRSQ
ncbi:hypothetical protein SAMN05660463_02467 [Pseudomonas sp. URIL14HWK12:I9]|nr:hypothetical protein F474_03432 [Pseudomonas sp. URIL14HWK12:I12]PVZ23222.1 hypothetical protein F470_02771 [Pseudomonas sp. URIL14HWK12:I10]PVZ32551.1 hypothetical protein F472_03118 [Pseudomonas sp. URIL14HWK12:I11]SNZ13650.1 hypothetical protein SAMN05660463_02467 [Pseudomonas sp. URIL14HWK12:I9]